MEVILHVLGATVTQAVRGPMSWDTTRYCELPRFLNRWMQAHTHTFAYTQMARMDNIHTTNTLIHLN